MKLLLICLFVVSAISACHSPASRAPKYYRLIISRQGPAREGGIRTEDTTADTARSDKEAYQHGYSLYFSSIYHSGPEGVELLVVPAGFRVLDHQGKEIRIDLTDKEKEKLESAVRGH